MPHTVLIVTTSTARLPDDAPTPGAETGFDWQSLALPYWRLREAGVALRFASIRGGKPPGDPATAADPERGEDERLGAVDMFLGDPEAIEALAHSEPVAQVTPDGLSGILLTDGLGGLWDLARNEALATLLTTASARGAIIASIGAGAAALTGARSARGTTTAPGGDADAPFVSGRSLTCLPDREIEARLGEVAPVLTESRLRAIGGQVQISPPDEPPAVIDDGRLITGQTAEASADVALQLLDALDVYAADLAQPDDQPAETDGM